MDFVAIDVETANADLASICQLGIASFRDGALAEKWVSLVNPEDEFDVINISIHGTSTGRRNSLSRKASACEFSERVTFGESR